MPIGWNVRQRQGLLDPDLLVAFGVDPDTSIERRGFAIDDIGKAPDFVLEVASINTAHNDETGKRLGYAAFGVPEYWRFDPTGGEFYGAPLAGDMLVDGEYRPITVVQTDENQYWGRSEVLNLSLCWEYGQLRWYDPSAQRYLRTHDEAEDDRIAEHGARIAAEAQRDAERQARVAAEARIRHLEEELRRRSQ